MSKLDLRNMDCMDLMREYPDKYFELAIVDPPYMARWSGKFAAGSGISTTGVARDVRGFKHWDVPKRQYFLELNRVSKNQIIWGCNYYAKHIDSVGRIIWDKKNDSSTFSKAEIASCSLNYGIQMFRYGWNGMIQEDMKNKEIRIHPTQKPVALYKWLLHNYAKQGDKIFDSHLGSGSIAIACHQMGFDLVGSELDKDHFEAMQMRIKYETAQRDLFL